jgi:hypothetical protein
VRGGLATLRADQLIVDPAVVADDSFLVGRKLRELRGASATGVASVLEQQVDPII